jgi:2-(3-amino-3-carboxypropyl)histidine synthase
MLETSSVLTKLKRLKAKKVFIQVPEGLKMMVLDFSKSLEKSGLTTYISVDPCFGACDLKDREAKALGCDAFLHIGHSDYGLKPALPVIYEEYRIEFDPTPLLRKNLPILKSFKRIGLATTVQYLSSLAKASTFLKKQGKKVILGTPSKGGHPGQILGCDYSSAKTIEPGVDCFLFLGTGTFHPLGLAIGIDKPTLFLDFESTELIDMAQEKRNLQKLRYAHIAKASQARNFGILVSTKPGQAHPKMAEQAKEKLESLGRRAWILVADMITPEKLTGLQVEALVNTACPRIREDAKLFKKPIISPEDIVFFEK